MQNQLFIYLQIKNGWINILIVLIVCSALLLLVYKLYNNAMTSDTLYVMFMWGMYWRMRYYEVIIKLLIIVPSLSTVIVRYCVQTVDTIGIFYVRYNKHCVIQVRYI